MSGTGSSRASEPTRSRPKWCWRMQGAQSMTEHETRDRIAGVKLSSPDKVLFEGQGLTKADLAAHYERRGRAHAALVEGRLVSLVALPGRRGRPVLLPAPRQQGHARCHETAGDRREGWRQGELSPARHAVLADCGRADGHAGVPHLGLARRQARKNPTGWCSIYDPDEGLDFEDLKQAAFRYPRQSVEARPGDGCRW